LDFAFPDLFPPFHCPLFASTFTEFRISRTVGCPPVFFLYPRYWLLLRRNPHCFAIETVVDLIQVFALSKQIFRQVFSPFSLFSF